MADLLATASDLATLLQQDVDTSSATMALELATGAIQTECGWRILQETVTGLTVLPIAAFGPIQLPTAHLTSLAIIEGGVVLVDGRDYSWTEAGTATRMGWGGALVFPLSVAVPWRLYPIVVTYTHGYATVDVPQLIRGVCLNVAARMFDNPTGLRSETAGQAQEVKSTGDQQSFAGPTLTALEARALLPYKADPLVVVA
jgi:hypothetical protein